MAVGVKHFTKDGKEYKGATHTMGGKMMTGATHTASSKPLVHKKDLPRKKAK